MTETKDHSEKKEGAKSSKSSYLMTSSVVAAILLGVGAGVFFSKLLVTGEITLSLKEIKRVASLISFNK